MAEQAVGHTPGPWESVRSLTCGHLRAAHNYQQNPREEWTDADLKLISAAPDLLAALRAIAVHQANAAGSMARVSTTWNIAVRAIEKAGFNVSDHLVDANNGCFLADDNSDPPEEKL